MSSKTQQQQVPQNTKKATEVHQQVEEVIGIMHNNIDKVVQRGEKLDSLQNKTEELQQGALSFKKTSNTVSNQM
jgi:vesicle-associated membrane protein 4